MPRWWPTDTSSTGAVAATCCITATSTAAPASVWQNGAPIDLRPLWRRAVRTRCGKQPPEGHAVGPRDRGRSAEEGGVPPVRTGSIRDCTGGFSSGLFVTLLTWPDLSGPYSLPAC